MHVHVLQQVFDHFDVRPWNRDSRQRNHDPDMLSCTVINARRPELSYNYGCSGFIIRASSARIRCAYPVDAGTLRYACSPTSGYTMAKRTLRNSSGTCLGGCGPEWCDEKTRRGEIPCAWRASQLLEVMQHQERVSPKNAAATCTRGPVACTYNEIVIDLTHWRESLPESVEAMFVTPGCEASKLRQVESWHTDLLKFYSGRLSAANAPLLLYDPRAQPAFRDITPRPPPAAPPSPPEPPPLPALPHDCSWRLNANFYDLRANDTHRWCSALRDQGRGICQQHFYFRNRRPGSRGGELVRCTWDRLSANRCVSGTARGVNIFSCPPPPVPPPPPPLLIEWSRRRRWST